MILAALVVGVILVAVGGIVNMIKYEGGSGYQIVGGVILGFAVLGLLICGADIGRVPEYNKQIEIYETEMTTIQETINDVVVNYLDHEKDTYAELTPENAVIFASIYPELASSELVKRQLEIYNNYLVSIKSVNLNWLVYLQQSGGCILVIKLMLAIIHSTLDPLWFLIPGLILLGVAIYLRLHLED